MKTSHTLALVTVCICFVNTCYAETTLTLATGSKEGVYYPLGLALKAAIEEVCPDIRIEVHNTNGSADNAQKMEKGDADLALMQNDIAYYFSKGKRMFSMPSSKVTGVASLYTEFVQIVGRRKLRIKELEDLKEGTFKVRTGSQKDITYSNAANILSAAGFECADISETKMPFDETSKSILGGWLDVAFVTAGIPTPTLEKVTGEVTFISIGPELARKLIKSYPFFVYCTIPPKTYLGQDQKITTVGVRALLVARADIPDHVVYKISAAIVPKNAIIDAANREDDIDAAYKKTINRVAKNITIDSATKAMTIPLHPGARQYYVYENPYWRKILVLVKPEISNVLILMVLIIFLIAYRRVLPKPVRANIYFRLLTIFGLSYAIISIAMFFCERHANRNFETLAESFWSMAVYVFSGFEDRPPVTLAGRITSISIFAFSLCFGGAITGRFAAVFYGKEKPEMPCRMKNHIAICNWNERGDKIVTELHSEQGEPETDIIVVAKQDVDAKELRRRSSKYEKVHFIKGDPTLHSVLENHKVHLARSVIILSDDESLSPDSNSTMIALAIQKLCGEKLRPPHIVAEVKNHARVRHLQEAGAKEVVCSTDYGLGVIAQCAFQAKLSDVYNNLLSYSAVTNEFYIVDGDRLPKNVAGKTFEKCASVLVRTRTTDNPVILVGVRRREKIFLNPRQTQEDEAEEHFDEINKGDALIVMAYHKPDLSDLYIPEE